MLCAISIRSNGSLWIGGSSINFSVWLPVIGNS